MSLSVLAFASRKQVPLQGGLRAPVVQAGGTSLRRWLAGDPGAADFPWPAGSVTELMVNGPPGTKLTIAVVGDGFAAADHDAYVAAVDRLFVSGLFAQDWFAANKEAFNLLRIDLVSAQSPCSTKSYAVTPPTQVDRDTALGVLYSGDWNHGWLEDGPQVAERLAQATRMWAPDPALVFVLLNDPGDGGLGGGGRATVPLGVTWSTVAHEIGHALGGLGDEYCKPPTSTGTGVFAGTTEPKVPNLTISTDPATLKWRAFVPAGTPLPTGTGACAAWPAGTRPATWDDNQSVGQFEGGAGTDMGVYRPVLSCRMNGNLPPYCPVCRAAMDARAAPNLDDVAGPAGPAGGGPVARTSGGYVRLHLRSEGGVLRVLEAREVEGDLVHPDEVTGGLAAEVVVGGRRVAVDAVPDAAVTRSFAEPGPDGPVDHLEGVRETFDLVARVPRQALVGAGPDGLSAALVDLGPARRLALADPVEGDGHLRVAALRRQALPEALLRVLTR